MEEKKVTLLTDSNGDQSSIRVAMMGTICIILGMFVFQNFASLIQALVKGKDINFVDFPTNAVYILSSVILGKVAQKFSKED